MVSEAIEFALGDPTYSPTIREICARFNINRRLLHYCFQEVLGVNPHTYLRSLRLNRASRDLRSPAIDMPGVSDIAAKWGFWHLPRFAAEYHALFGELPSKTRMPALLSTR